MIGNEVELRHTYEQLARMYALREKANTEPSWSGELREDVAAGIDAMIRKLESEVSAYLAIRARLAA